MVPLSILDLFPVAAGRVPSQSIHDGLELARRADELGYLRYWVAEHHNMPSIATAAPEVILAAVASVTRRIRVGAGGIMVPNHTPLRVVEIFRTLAALFPDRIDLGLGRAPGTDPVTASALRRRGDVDQQLAELFAFAFQEFPEGHPFHDILAMPTDVALPPIFMLGSTNAGASIGAARGVRYAFAGHFAMAGARDAMHTYRSRFQPSPRLERPYAILACTVICGEDDEHARWLAGPLRAAILAIRTGRRAPLLSFDDAAKLRFGPMEEAAIDDFLAGAVIGGPAHVREGLERLQAETGADELMLATMMPEPKERLASYERVAKL